MTELVSRRKTRLNQREPIRGPVVYWMDRDQRIADNWALIAAQQHAIGEQVPLAILFCPGTEPEGGTERQQEFMMTGLQEIEHRAIGFNMPLFIRQGDPAEAVPMFARELKAGMIVTDFSPLRKPMELKHRVASRLEIAMIETDAHNIVPARSASGKLEWAARTIRPRIGRLIPEYLGNFPSLTMHPWQLPEECTALGRERNAAVFTNGVKGASTGPFTPGETAAMERLRRFISEKLDSYATDKNNPALDGLSGLSPYLRFGQISAQRVALEVSGTEPGKGRDAFLEELIVRRELSDNYCLYNPAYDRFEGAPGWAGRTLVKHWDDQRRYLYSTVAFEHAETHDPLWNAAQREMRESGKMHGYLRMYWAKKILEWSRTPEEAFGTAVYLNDKYSLDGRDPNGYAGIAWAVAGVHDRPWKERPVFGTIRYMSYEGCRRKFDVDAYVRKWS